MKLPIQAAPVNRDANRLPSGYSSAAGIRMANLCSGQSCTKSSDCPAGYANCCNSQCCKSLCQD
jgi:hypothetical protein